MNGNAALEPRWGLAMPPKKSRARFPRAVRLLRHADFEDVYKQGRRHFSASMTVFYRPRPGKTAELQENRPQSNMKTREPEGVRVGFTVSRALGGAVVRNRMKRRLREAVRLSGLPERVAVDVVINPKKSLLGADFSAVLNEVSRAMSVIEQKVRPQRAEKTASEAAADRIGGKPDTDFRN
jgi:ribonuclease P protein component